jgi:hypothetical protein
MVRAGHWHSDVAAGQRGNNPGMRTLIVLLTALFALSACHRERPAEKAGRKLDQAGRDLRDAVKGGK